MKLLICTQTVDENDPFLSFFVGWLSAFAKRFDRIEVICLKEGEYHLAATVAVHSLGKELQQGRSFLKGPSLLKRVRYVAQLYRYAWDLRNDYDAVFVHMNQEYVLLCALLWKCLGKKVYLWRNHQAGNFWTTLAVALSDKVFCTSTFSYTARFPKTVLMPVGVDTDLYRTTPGSARIPRSILFFARFAPAKRPLMLVEALGKLKEKGIRFSASLYGDPLAHDISYRERVKQRAHEIGLDEIVRFEEGVPHARGPAIFNTHEISVNLAASGMYDKTIFEAAACGALVLACSKDFAAHVAGQFIFAEGDLDDLVSKLEALLELSESAKQNARIELQQLAQENSLDALSARLAREIQ